MEQNIDRQILTLEEYHIIFTVTGSQEKILTDRHIRN